MVAVHQRQLLSWEEDRQRVLTLEERCSKLEGELHKRTEIIRSLMKKVKVLESNQIECQTALQKTQLQLQEMAQKATHSSLLSEDLEARNENLSNTLVALSAQVGQLQAREQALTTTIKLKDKDIIEAVNHIADCSGKFKLLEHALRDAKMVENSVVKEKQDYKQRLKALKIEVNKLKVFAVFPPSVCEEDLNEKTTENNEQREEIIRLKQEKSCLHDELIFTVEREKRKDELLDIAKSKQERTNSELHNLRQIYIKQQSDLQFLNFNVENSQQFIQIYDSKMEESKSLESSRDMCLWDLENNHPKIDVKREKSSVKDHKFEAVLAQQNWPEKSPCDVCKEKKLQPGTAFAESVITLSSLFPKDLTEKPKSWPLGAKTPIEPESKITPRRVHAKFPEDDGPGRQGVYLGLACCCCCGPGQAGKLDAEAREALPRSGSPSCAKSQGAPDDRVPGEPACCHPRSSVEAPGHMSDAEGMSVFQPAKVQRIVRHKTVCTCSGVVDGGDCGSAARELTAIQQSHCLSSSKSATREDETEASPGEKSLPTSLLIDRDSTLSTEKDDFSPTSKLQRLLAESRQMVTDLELSTLLPLGCQDPSGGARTNLEISEESAQKNTFISP
ncbi:coiled-coil domain-containing protein 62 isoform X2 [Heterocephalus glaber]|uniref:Coiled-coil domain-containing protein 62 isoform X2 n=1 Tax=Heterocephalus glaber TaxID=10181 RepID=A0AAX6SZQ0_HETGA|nr:coiled-coil domain-containing protein 62 isoform X2 [Heterocephalus glaber]